MKSREEVKSENRKNYNQKGHKSKGQFSSSNMVQTIESQAINDSIFETENDGYDGYEG
ncbi:hypothetical protein KQI86_02295 [Clostridium sp. MSJ-11]|uniref:Uncharacterized protein n=1 Tax=Clostridium mobile TaxID=2841512 RepID=A0ABS6ED67_9CLOT|nr:hypothetical protein [Clostridium mobile]MBU5483139.1 hypothetical protein [Clostridium mobile]